LWRNSRQRGTASGMRTASAKAAKDTQRRCRIPLRSPANIGRDKDSERRQRLAVERFAKSGGYAVVDWFNDPAVSGADPIESRPGFAALLNRIEGNGVRVVLVEDASRPSCGRR
jgi:hypothetical protein